MDTIDDAQAKAEQYTAQALSMFRKAAGNTRRVKACIECGEPISELRQSLGAARCVACQTEYETAARRESRA